MSAWQSMDTAPKDRLILIRDAQFGIVTAQWDEQYRWMIEPRATDFFGCDNPMSWAEIPPEE
jgi:hypothetical protein